MDIKILGLKSSYIFREARISLDGEKIHTLLKDRVGPAVRELESSKLINGFHYIIHKDIDLRISSDAWPQYLCQIQKVLATFSIPPELREWKDGMEMPPEKYGGPTGVLLCYNNLEFNSRLCLALIELMSEAKDAAAQQSLMKLCPHQWVHYLCNQFGYLNLDQISFELNDAFCWLEVLLRQFPTIRDAVRQLVDDHKTKIKEFEDGLLDG